MTNREHYEELCDKWFRDNTEYAGLLDFSEKNGCGVLAAMRFWLDKEYKEEIRLNRLEYEYLKLCKMFGYEYIVRTSLGKLELFLEQPQKDSAGYWSSSFPPDVCDDRINRQFQFIEYEDKMPTNISDLLKNSRKVVAAYVK